MTTVRQRRCPRGGMKKFSRRTMATTTAMLLPICSTAFSPTSSVSRGGRFGLKTLEPDVVSVFSTSTSFRPFAVTGPLNDEFAASTSALSMSVATHGECQSRSSCCGQSSSNSHLHSAKDWLHNMKTLPQSTVFRDIRNPVLTIATWGTMVSILYKALLYVGRGKMASMMCLSSAPFSMLMSSLGLLLVFRTNSAYQRFNEGRIIWERIHSTSRNLSRMLSLYEEEITTEKRRRMQELLASFPYLLRHHIRPKCIKKPESIQQSNDGLLLHEPPLPSVQTRHEGDKLANERQSKQPRRCWVDKREMPWCLFKGRALHTLASIRNRPLWACDRMAETIVRIPYGPNFTSRERLKILGDIEKLTKAIGECERIHQTAVPLNYARHSLRSLSIWLFTVPFALIKDLGLLTGPTMGVIAWLLFGVYQIGYSIEDPFQGSIRLSILCDAIRRDVLGEHEDREIVFADDNIDVTENIIEQAVKSADAVMLVGRTKDEDMLREVVDEKLLQERELVPSNGTWM